ncbi:MAG TPA: hypothetical protein PK342_11905, partial [Methylotenera sp.]|nr:hypothetical protein [Methylotenera sp.]
KGNTSVGRKVSSVHGAIQRAVSIDYNTLFNINKFKTIIKNHTASRINLYSIASINARQEASTTSVETPVVVQQA